VRKIIVLGSIIVIVAFLCAFAQSASQLLAQIVHFQIIVDGTEKFFSLPIVTINDRTYIPLREMAETLGMNAEWDGETKIIEITTKKQENGENLFVFRKNEKYGYMDRVGNIIVDAQFDWASDDFVEGAARVCKNIDDILDHAPGTVEGGRWGFIDINGEIIIPLKYALSWNFNEGLALVKEVDGPYYYIDKQGEKSSQIVIGNKFSNKGYFPKLVKGGESFPMPDPLPEVWSYIDNTGELANNKEFEKAGEFSGELAIVKNNGKYAVIDTGFNIVIDYKYDDLRKVDIDLFSAKQGEKWGLIDKSDKVIADFVYNNIAPFSEGLAPVSTARDSNGWLTDSAYIDRNGKLVLDSKYSLTSYFIDGFACVCDKNSGKYGVIDRSGKYVIEPKYYYLNQRKSGLIEAQDQRGSDYYYINLNGSKVEPK
jgi:hypothetical protein